MISRGPILVKRAKVLTKLKTPIDLSVKQRNKVLTNYVPSGPIQHISPGAGEIAAVTGLLLASDRPSRLVRVIPDVNRDLIPSFPANP